MTTQQNPTVTKLMTTLAKESSLTTSQLDLITETVAKGATIYELQLFLYTAKRVGLDPLTKQIHFIKRRTRQPDGTYKEVGTIQTGIDGYRAIAERTGTLAGIDDATFDTETEVHPNKATVTVYRMVSGQRVGFTASARWSEYAQQYNGKIGGLWAKMPYLMLAKCAEALALRKAFPNDLSGLYTNEEMTEADTDVLVEATQTPKTTPAHVVGIETKEIPVQATTTPKNANYDVAGGIDKGQIFLCSITGQQITKAEYEYSLKHFGKALCRAEQAIERGRLMNQ